jgi:hypothetical protein
MRFNSNIIWGRPLGAFSTDPQPATGPIHAKLLAEVRAVRREVEFVYLFDGRPWHEVRAHDDEDFDGGMGSAFAAVRDCPDLFLDEDGRVSLENWLGMCVDLEIRGSRGHGTRWEMDSVIVLVSEGDSSHPTIWLNTETWTITASIDDVEVEEELDAEVIVAIETVLQ